MKRIVVTITFLLTLSAGCSLVAKRGACMDNSHHLQQGFDHKSYHYVPCNCSCKQLFANKGLCRECGHARDPQKQELITTVPTQGQKRQILMRSLVESYKKQKLIK